MKQMNFKRSILLALLLLAVLAVPVLAQADEFVLDVQRTFGYGLGSNIQGNFRLSITVNSDKVAAVTFLLDEKPLAPAVTQSPFQIDIVTDNYALGWHEFSAEVKTLDGRTVRTPNRRFNFVAPSEAMGTVLPIIGVVLGITAVGIFLQFTMTKSKKPAPGEARSYGFAGGTICPKCGRPFARHAFAPNMLLGKLDRCDNCGKWSIVRAMPIEVLRAAERAELEAVEGERPQVAEKTEEEKMREMLDNSKYSS